MTQLPKSVAVIAIGTLVLSVRASTQVGNALPVEEHFRSLPGLEVSLDPNPALITVDQPLSLAATFTNRGRQDVSLNPRLVLNLFIDTDAGQPAPQLSAIADSVLIEVEPKEFVRLAPGLTWTTQVYPFHRYRDTGRFGFYGKHSGSNQLQLRPGSYRLRLEAINFPHYGSSYDVTRAPKNAWEGKVVARAALRIAPLSDSVEREWLSRLDAGQLSSDEFEILVRNDGAATTDAFVERLQRYPQDRSRMAGALVSSQREEVLMRLTQVLLELPDAEFLNLAERLADTRASLNQPFAGLRSRRDCQAASQLVARSPRTQNFAQLVRRCEEVRLTLRDIITDSARRVDDRGGAARLLGQGKQTTDVKLLGDVLAGVVNGSPPKGWSNFDHMRNGAVFGLAAIPGPEATTALVEALGSEEARAVWSEIIRALGERGDQSAVPPLIQLLSDRQPLVVSMALSSLLQLKAAAALRAVLPLLNHSDRSVRSVAAAFVVRSANDGSALETMRTAFARGDSNVRSQALSYLGRYGDESDLPVLEEQLTSSNQQLRSSAMNGLSRLGTAATAGRVHELIRDTRANDGELKPLLYRLTFRLFTDEEEWQRWWRIHGRESRTTWALSTLRGSLAFSTGRAAFDGTAALGYLSSQSDAVARPAVESAVAARYWSTRVAAAYALKRWDRQKSEQLLARELENRSYAACQRAAQLLERSTSDGILELDSMGTPFSEDVAVDCRDPDSRLRATAKWRR
jgi:HEAT repeat protein